MKHKLFATILYAIPLAFAQNGVTRVDLRTQARNVDFGAADSTRPVKTGAALPGTCNPGELFFNTTAAVGANLFGCAGTNQWVVQGANTGTTTKLDGVAVGTESAQNFITGSGTLSFVSDTGSEIRIQQSVDTAVVATNAALQSGAPLLCQSTTGSGASYGCSMTPTLSAYSAGMTIHWIPDTDGLGGATVLNIDFVGPRPLKLPDGITDPLTADILAGQQYDLWFDGVSFRLPSAASINAVPTRPACTASIRGRIWHTAGAPGSKDVVAICAKDAAETYDWRILY